MSAAVAAVASPEPLRLPLVPRPRTRGDCKLGPRPCSWIGCRFHLAIERRGLPGDPQTCALDVADRAGATLEEIAEVLGVTREMVRQIQAGALARLVEALRRRGVLGRGETPTEVIRALLVELRP